MSFVLLHPFGTLFVLTVIVFAIAIALWNLVPSLRDKMRGYSTIVESILGLFVTVFGEISGGIQDAQAAGYIPPQLLAYVPIVLFLYFIMKRLQTTTPVAVKPGPWVKK